MDTENPNSNQSQEQDPKKGSPAIGVSPENLQKEFQDLVEKKFGGKVQVLSMDDSFQFGPEADIDDDFDSDDEELQSLLEEFAYKPQDLKQYLDRFVVGQEEAKKALSVAVCDHYNHLKAAEESDDPDSLHYQKQNVLIMGPTGVGKTYLVRLISELIGVPFVKADATRFSEVGYMGANVDDIIRDLVQVAGGDQNLASKGIVYVDEVDKLASRRDHTGRDVSGRGVQFGFLRLLENSDVDLNASHDIASQFKTFMNFQRKGKAEKEIVNTRDILFIFSGAFHGLEEVIGTRKDQKAIGVHQDKSSQNQGQILQQAESRDLVQFGFEHEFIGRLPIRVACENLEQEDLYKILTLSEQSILSQYVQSFAHYGIELKFTEEALQEISRQALKQETGARGLTAVMEELLRPFKFELPSQKITQLEVGLDMLNNPQGYLHHLLNN